MKIGIIAHDLTKPTGAVRVEIMQAKVLKQRGHEPVLYTMAFDKERCYPELLNDLDIQIIRTGWRLAILSTSFKAISFACRPLGFSENLDYVIAHSFPRGFLGTSLKRRHGTCFVLFLHGIWGYIHPKSDDPTGKAPHTLKHMRRDKHRFTDWIFHLLFTHNYY